MKQVHVWSGGIGELIIQTVARNEAEALNNLIEKEPILAAIGCSAWPLEDVDGCKVVALVPDDFEFGDDRRSKAEKARKAEDAKLEKATKAEQDAEAKKISDAQKKAEKEAEEAEAKRKAEELKTIDAAVVEDILG